MTALNWEDPVLSNWDTARLYKKNSNNNYYDNDNYNRAYFQLSCIFTEAFDRGL